VRIDRSSSGLDAVFKESLESQFGFFEALAGGERKMESGLSTGTGTPCMPCEPEISHPAPAYFAIIAIGAQDNEACPGQVQRKKWKFIPVRQRVRPVALYSASRETFFGSHFLPLYSSPPSGSSSAAGWRVPGSSQNHSARAVVWDCVKVGSSVKIGQARTGGGCARRPSGCRRRYPNPLSPRVSMKRSRSKRPVVVGVGISGHAGAGEDMHGLDIVS